MSSSAEPAPSAERAQALLLRASQEAGALLDGLLSFGFLKEPKLEAKRMLVRRAAEELLVFVLLSVLLESREGKDPGEKKLAELVKAAFLAQILETRQQALSMVEKSLRGPDALELKAGIDKASRRDPFELYYDSFSKARKSPEEGPFGIFARRVAEAHFDGPMYAAAYSRLFELAALHADRLLDSLSASG